MTRQEAPPGEMPAFVDGRGWTCPPGYAFPKCRGCGHNYFEAKPWPVDAQGRAPDGGLCHWCIAELSEATEDDVLS